MTARDAVLGIDLGTTNSVVAVADGREARVLADADGQMMLPSVVSFPAKGGVLVGEIARERRLFDAASTVYGIKRLIGRPYESEEVTRAKERFAFELTPDATGGVRVKVRNTTRALPEISAFVLREARHRAQQALGLPCESSVITVPASFNELQRSATMAAGRIAGLQVLRILNEPTAAAVAYGYGADQTGRIAVYDLGGGTFDITILELDGDVFEVLGTGGDTFLGGDDFDLMVAEAMADTFVKQHGWDPRKELQAFERLRAAGEWAKCQLSSHERVEVRVAELAHGPSGAALDLDFVMTRPELEQRIDNLVLRSMSVCEATLKLANVKPTDITSVILVGGSTRIPLVQQRVADYFGRTPQASIDPDLVVALGASMQAYALAGDPAALRLAGVAPPTAEQARAVAQAKADARAQRPAQPAFASAPIPAGSPSMEPPAPPSKARPGTLPGVEASKNEVPVPVVAAAAAPQGKMPKRTMALEAGAAIPGDPIAHADADYTPIARVKKKTVGFKDEPLTGPLEKPKGIPVPDIAPSPTMIGVTAAQLKAQSSQGMSAAKGQSSSGLAAFSPELEDAFGEVTAGSVAKPLPGPSAKRPTADLGAPLPPKRVTADLGAPATKQGPGKKRGTLDIEDPFAERGAPQPVALIPIPSEVPSGEVLLLDDMLDDAPAPAEPWGDLLDVNGAPAPSAPGRASAPSKGGRTSFSFDDLIEHDSSGAAPLVDAPIALPPAEPAKPTQAGAKIEPAKKERGDRTMLGIPVVQPPVVQPIAPSSKPGVQHPTLAEESAPEELTMPAPQPVVLAMPNRALPILMDVTPHSLAVETVGGFCERVIRRNAAIPVEQRSIFTTANDDQDTVRVAVCQGEARLFKDNQSLGQVELTGIRKARRGVVKIEVTFMLDANGTLDVRARDTDTGREQRIQVNLTGGLADSEIEKIRGEQDQAQRS